MVRDSTRFFPLELIGWEGKDDGNGAQKTAREQAERRERARIDKLEGQITKNEIASKHSGNQLVIEADRTDLAQKAELSKKIGRLK